MCRSQTLEDGSVVGLQRQNLLQLLDRRICASVPMVEHCECITSTGEFRAQSKAFESCVSRLFVPFRIAFTAIFRPIGFAERGMGEGKIGIFTQPDQ